LSGSALSELQPASVDDDPRLDADRAERFLDEDRRFERLLHVGTRRTHDE
jgi:hypothetical protein